MPNDNVMIEQVSCPADLEHCFNIRKEVFIKEQNVPESLEIDGLDKECDQYLLRYNDIPCATARIRLQKDTAKIERMAINANYRKKGLGKRLLEFMLKDCLYRYKIKQFELSAQCHAIEFYEKLGFKVCSDTYLDAGIQHKMMRKSVN